MYAWGDNRRGAVGFRAEAVGKVSGGGSRAGHFVSRPRRVVPGTETTAARLLALSCSNDAVLFLTTDHELFIWGEALDNPGAPDHRDGAVQLETPMGVLLTDLACGEMHVVCADAGGACWGFGYSDYGKLGQYNTQWCSLTPESASASVKDGSRPSVLRRMAIPSDGRRAILAAGSNHTMVGVSC